MITKKKFLPWHLFVLITGASIIFSVLWLIRTDGSCLNTIVSGDGNDRFMDFFNHISYVRDPQNVYYSSFHACFPPFIYLMYFLFSKMLPADATVIQDAYATSSYALLLYVFYCTILTVFLFYSVFKLAKNKSTEFSLILALLIMSSNIFIFGALERGNSTLIVCILLMRAIELKDRESKSSHEIALILIAIAAAIKIYPAIFGLVYLFEKRWKEACRLVIYGLLFFFVPFLFFGGAEGFFQFINNQTIVQSANYRGMASLHAFWNLISAGWLHLETKDYGSAIVIIYVILAVIGSKLSEDLWKRTLLLSSIMMLAPFWSGRYTGIYLALPLVLFLSKNQYKTVDYLFAFLFACMFLFLTYNNTDLAGIMSANLPSVIEYLALYLMNILLITEAIVKFVRRKGISARI